MRKRNAISNQNIYEANSSCSRKREIEMLNSVNVVRLLVVLVKHQLASDQSEYFSAHYRCSHS